MPCLLFSSALTYLFALQTLQEYAPMHPGSSSVAAFFRPVKYKKRAQTIRDKSACTQGAVPGQQPAGGGGGAARAAGAVAAGAGAGGGARPGRPPVPALPARPGRVLLGCCMHHSVYGVRRMIRPPAHPCSASTARSCPAGKPHASFCVWCVVLSGVGCAHWLGTGARMAHKDRERSHTSFLGKLNDLPQSQAQQSAANMCVLAKQCWLFFCRASVRPICMQH